MLPLAGLVALRDALRQDDGALTQGATSIPPPLRCVGDWPVEAACPVGYCGWQGDGRATVDAVGDFFVEVCCAADKAVGVKGTVAFLNWWDDTPRHEAFAALLPEVELAIAARGGVS